MKPRGVFCLLVLLCAGASGCVDTECFGNFPTLTGGIDVSLPTDALNSLGSVRYTVSTSTFNGVYFQIRRSGTDWIAGISRTGTVEFPSGFTLITRACGGCAETNYTQASIYGGSVTVPIASLDEGLLFAPHATGIGPVVARFVLSPCLAYDDAASTPTSCLSTRSESQRCPGIAGRFAPLEPRAVWPTSNNNGNAVVIATTMSVNSDIVLDQSGSDAATITDQFFFGYASHYLTIQAQERPWGENLMAVKNVRLATYNCNCEKMFDSSLVYEPQMIVSDINIDKAFETLNSADVAFTVLEWKLNATGTVYGSGPMEGSQIMVMYNPDGSPRCQGQPQPPVQPPVQPPAPAPCRAVGASAPVATGINTPIVLGMVVSSVVFVGTCVVFVAFALVGSRSSAYSTLVQ